MAPQPMIELQSVRFEYGGAPANAGGTFVLDVGTLTVGAGERAACIGPSGSGKTTLVNLVAGILVPSRGIVRVNSVEVSALSDAERRAVRLRDIGMVFQEFELLDHMSAMDNILLPYIIAGKSRAGDTAAAAADLAESLGIGHVLRRKPRRLSHGERQRVGICRALITRPRLLLCDEPTGNLDPDATAATLDLLLSQASERGATVVMVTHNHHLLDRFDQVIDMRLLVGVHPQYAAAEENDS